MTRPNAFAGANYSSPRFNGEAPDQSSTRGVPQDEAWREAFHANLAAPRVRPTLQAYQGYDYTDWGKPFYWFDGGKWLDTMTGAEWGGVKS